MQELEFIIYFQSVYDADTVLAGQTEQGVNGDPGSVAAQSLGALGAGMVGMAMMMPDLNFQQGGQGVGAAGGGGLPTDFSIPTAALSLALVPLGLSAVAIFPPFARLVEYPNNC